MPLRDRLVRVASSAAAIGAMSFPGLPAPAQQSGAPGVAASAVPVRINVDLRERIGPYEPIYRWFGYDEANYTTSTNGQMLLRELHDLSPEPVFVRVHHLLTSGDGTPELKWSSTGVYREDETGNPIYDWHLLDAIFDGFKASGVKPMVELGFMPKDLAATEPTRPYHVPFPQGDVLSGASNNPPKDYRKWQALTEAVTRHLVERYGRDEVLGWYFEVWNEPDIPYWHGTAEDYLKLYDYSVAGVRSALPGARVGGPATTSPRSDKARAFLKLFLDHAATGRSEATGGPVPLDFITFHAKGSPQVQDGMVTMGPDRELADVDRGFALIASYSKLRGLPIILSEADPEGCAACSAKTNPANAYRNGTLYPAYTAAVYKRMFMLAARDKVNLLGMLSWSFEFEGRESFEGFRSLATNGVDKPALNFFRMAGMLGGEQVSVQSDGEIALESMLTAGVRGESDVTGIATTQARDAELLMWNYRDTERGALARNAQVHMSGLPDEAKRVLVEEFRVDTTHGNAYSEWQAMGSPAHPSTEQTARLQRAGMLGLADSPHWHDVQAGDVSLAEMMPGESLLLVRLSW